VRLEDAFAFFDQQDSGCLPYGVERAGRRWFVKTATEPRAARPMTVRQLGRTLQQLLTEDRATGREVAVAARATDPAPGRRHRMVAALAADWRS
jgi:hypothetical protein